MELMYKISWNCDNMTWHNVIFFWKEFTNAFPVNWAPEWKQNFQFLMQFEGFGNLRGILCNNAYDCIYKNLQGTGEKAGEK